MPLSDFSNINDSAFHKSGGKLFQTLVAEASGVSQVVGLGLALGLVTDDYESECTISAASAILLILASDNADKSYSPQLILFKSNIYH